MTLRLSKLQVEAIKQHYKEEYGAESSDELWDDLLELDLPGPTIERDGPSDEECYILRSEVIGNCETDGIQVIKDWYKNLTADSSAE